MKAGFSKKALAVVHLPPPVSGLSFISSEMVRVLGLEGDVKAIRTTGGTGSYLRQLARKISGVLKGSALCLTAPKAVPLYTTAEGGRGLLYTCLICLSARLAGRRIFIHHHSYNYINQPYSLMRWLIKLSGAGQAHIFLSEGMKQRFERIYGVVAASHVISNCAFIAPISYAEVDRRNDKTVVLGHLSNLLAEKGVFIFLDLVEVMHDSGFAVKAVLGGAASDPTVQQEIEHRCAKLADVIDYRGAIYGEAKADFYRDIDIFIFPTKYRNEAQPAVIFEAMSAGVSVVASDRGSIAEQIESSGLVVQQDAEFLTSATEFVRDYIATRPSHSARALVSSNYAIQRRAASVRLDDFIRDVWR